MRAPHLGIVLGMSVAMLGGCVESRGFHEGRGAASVETDCPFDAADMRLHPLSRIVWTTPGGGDAAEPALDAHIEIVDAWGDTAKALGVFRLELRRTGLREGDLSDAVRWEVDLRDPSTNSAKFDRVTQTYLLRLADLPAWVSNDPYAVLNATFVRLDGVSMNSTLRISARAN